ncbi:hypothetical protein BC829DRAFT_414776 [Chytridium lagenaria]|nr:hypothetical protein BC829DRAFT_414776 [Chytridium lagenaria]
MSMDKTTAVEDTVALERDFNDAQAGSLDDVAAPAAEKFDASVAKENEEDQDVEVKDSTILEEVWLSIFTAGINSRVEFFMDMCFYALFVSLFLLLTMTSFNPHVIFLFVISICLFASVKWFLAEVAKIKQSQPETQLPQITEETKKDQ